MKTKLIKEINRFYDEMENEESTDIGELACNLVPKLVYRIKELESLFKEDIEFKNRQGGVQTVPPSQSPTPKPPGRQY